MSDKVYTHKHFGELTQFELDRYLEFVSFAMQKINSLEVYDVENDPTPSEYDDVSLNVFRQIIDKKDEVEGDIIDKDHNTAKKK